MMTAAEAHAIGLVDEVAPIEQVVERAIAWCQGLLALPPIAMEATRRLARRDLTCLFEDRRSLELETLTEGWFSPETQQALHALVARLAERRG
jgi:enoyl-CoA hydratase/carnithine racemase